MSEEVLSEEELLVYECEEVQSRVERIRAKVRHAEEHPQEATLPLIRVLTRNLQMCKSEYTKLHQELTFAYQSSECASHKEMKMQFDKLYRETMQDLQAMEISLLYPPVLYQPVMYVPVQFLQPQGTLIEFESQCPVVTIPPVEASPTEPTKVAIKVGAPSIQPLLNVIPSHDELDREHPPAVSKTPSLKVSSPPTTSNYCKPTKTAELSLSPTMSDSQPVAVDGHRSSLTTLSDEPASSNYSNDGLQRKQIDAYEDATSWCTTQCAVAAQAPDGHNLTESKPSPRRDNQRVKGCFDRWPVQKPTVIDAKQQRPSDRKWRYHPPRPPESKDFPEAANIYRRPEAVIYSTKAQHVLILTAISEGLHPSAGGRMFGLHSNELTV